MSSPGARTTPSSQDEGRAVDWSAVHARLEATARRLAEQSTPISDASALLKRRARALAAPAVSSTEAAEKKKQFQFFLDETRYAVDAAAIREVVANRPTTPVPGTPAHVLGLINLRSRVMPVIDLRIFFSRPTRAHEESEQLVVIDRRGVLFALLVSSVVGLISESAAGPMAPALLAHSLNPEFVAQVAPDGCVLLELDALIVALTINEDVEL